MSNADYLAGHRHQIENAEADAAPQAFLPVRERDLFTLGPENTVMGEQDRACQGLLFPDICLEQPELQSIMEDHKQFRLDIDRIDISIIDIDRVEMNILETLL